MKLRFGPLALFNITYVFVLFFFFKKAHLKGVSLICLCLLAHLGGIFQSFLRYHLHFNRYSSKKIREFSLVVNFIYSSALVYCECCCY